MKSTSSEPGLGDIVSWRINKTRSCNFSGPRFVSLPSGPSAWFRLMIGCAAKADLD